MSNDLESALADEVLAQVAGRRFTHKEMQELSGIKQRTWGNYFIQRDRAIPFAAVEKIAHALGMRTSELLALAEQRAANAPSSQDKANAAIARMSPAARRKIQEVRPDDPPEQGAAHSAV